MRIRNIVIVAAALSAVSAHASKITVSVSKRALETRVLSVVFADEPVTADVAVSVDARDADLDPVRWWQQLTWTLQEASAADARRLAPKSIEVVNASRNRVSVGTMSQHRGIF